MTERWRVLRPDTAGDVALAFDFTLGRDEPGFVDLEPMLETDCGLWECLPLPGLAGTLEAAPERYLRAYLDEVVASGVRVRSVLGYCAGGNLAGAFAERLPRAAGYRIPVILIDPEPVPLSYLRRRFDESIDVLGAELTTEELADVRQCHRQEAQSTVGAAGSADGIAARLSEQYRRIVRSVFARLGLDDEIAIELGDRFRDFMTYLAAAHGLQDMTWTSDFTVISMNDTGWFQPPGDARRIRFEHAGVGALADARVADAVSTSLALAK